MTIVTCLPASSWAQDGCQALVPGMAIAGRPQERAATMSGGPSTRMTWSEISRAGCGISPSRVPGTATHLRVAAPERVVAEHAAQSAVRVADRDGDPRAVEPEL